MYGALGESPRLLAAEAPEGFEAADVPVQGNTNTSARGCCKLGTMSRAWRAPRIRLLRPPPAAALVLAASLASFAGCDQGEGEFVLRGERIWVYVMAGQSNMVGIGESSSLSGEDATGVSGAFIYVAPWTHPNTRTRRWYPLGPGFGADVDRFGPELSFGRRMRQLFPERHIAIIKVAEGSTGLHDRWRARGGDLYRLLVDTVQAEMETLTTQGGRPQLAGLLWMQGESDAVFDVDAEAYQQNFTDFVLDLRSDLRNTLMPVVSGLIATDRGWTYADTVRGATSQVAAQTGRLAAVETDDLPMDTTSPEHYDTEGNLQLGVRLADALASLQPTQWRFGDDCASVQGQKCWTYVARSPNGASPLAYDDYTHTWTGAVSGPMIGHGWMWPTAAQQAELDWWAPFAGDVEIWVRVSAPPPYPASDGVALQSAASQGHITALVGSGYPTAASLTLNRTVVLGDRVSFRTTAGTSEDLMSNQIIWHIAITMKVDE
jgi:hypothetical protein